MTLPTFRRDPKCRRPVDSQLWGSWCSLQCAHRWVWAIL
jgi:hypothetical protein